MNSYCEQSCICCRDKTIDKDCFEQCYSFEDISSVVASAVILWEADGVTSSSGTLALEVTAISPVDATLDLLLNGSSTPVVTGLDLDDSIIITSDDLDEIQIAATDTTIDATVDLCVNVSYECC